MTSAGSQQVPGWQTRDREDFAKPDCEIGQASARRLARAKRDALTKGSQSQKCSQSAPSRSGRPGVGQLNDGGFVEQLDRALGDARLDLFLQQAMRHRVVHKPSLRE